LAPRAVPLSAAIILSVATLVNIYPLCQCCKSSSEEQLLNNRSSEILDIGNAESNVYLLLKIPVDQGV
jgi:hypothetical protein